MNPWEPTDMSRGGYCGLGHSNTYADHVVNILNKSTRHVLKAFRNNMKTSFMASWNEE